MDNERYELIFRGNSITHAAIANKERIAFILKSEDNEDGVLDYHEVETSIVLYNPSIWREKKGVACVSVESNIYLAWVAFTGREHNTPTIVAEQYRELLEFAEDSRWLSKNMNWIKPAGFQKTRMGSSINGIKHIGDSIYVVGRFRKLLKRTGPDRWLDLTDEKVHTNLHTDLYEAIERAGDMGDTNVGFYDVDGFSETDIYAVGDETDLWHYNGKEWIRMDPPTNFSSECILCAPDGYVYVAGGIGHILKGRYNSGTGKEEWKLLKTDIYMSDTWIQSMAWFDGKIYLGSDWALYCLEQDESLYKYQFPEDGVHQYSFQNVTACDDLLLSYGPHQALVYDGNKWEQILGTPVIAVPDDSLFDIRSHLG